MYENGNESLGVVRSCSTKIFVPTKKGTHNGMQYAM
jgi:hypothetical protein